MLFADLRRVLWTAAALALARPAAAAPAFTYEGGVLVASASVQSVVPITGGWRMYLSSAGFRVVSASSTDQVTWTQEAGVRLSTAAGGADASSITAVGVVPSTDPASGWRMYYVGVDGAGLYRVLSATSTDGLSWGKEGGTRVVNNAGLGAIASLSPFRTSSSLLRLYYVADQNGTNDPAQFRVHSATAVDGGVNFSTEGVRVSGSVAYAVSATTLTGGNTRIYYTNPLAPSTTASRVLSARASDGLAFSEESDLRLSTSASVAALGGLVVVRATESWRWRMFLDFTVGGTTQTIVSRALTRTPVVDSFTPRFAQKGNPSVSYQLSGEIFSLPAPAVGFVLGASTFNAASVTRTDDTSLSGTFSAVNRSVGRYAAAVTNADGPSGSLANAMEIELPPGSVSILDNLFRPLKGGQATITVDIFDPGEVTIRLYTVDGGLVATLHEGPMPAGQTAVTWNGRTPSGSVVASGVYLVHITAPALNTVRRVVVIK